MRTLIKSYRLFLSFSVCHLIILRALAAGCSNGTLDATHLKELELLFCLCTFEPWRARNRRHYPLRAAVLLYHNCSTGAKLHALLVPVPPAGQPCHFVVLRRSSLWCHHQLNRVKLTQSCWKGLWWIKRISKSYIALYSSATILLLSGMGVSGSLLHSRYRMFSFFLKGWLFFAASSFTLKTGKSGTARRDFFPPKLLNVFGLCFAPFAYTRWLPVR